MLENPKPYLLHLSSPISPAESPAAQFPDLKNALFSAWKTVPQPPHREILFFL
jgi:hypothetical protein